MYLVTGGAGFIGSNLAEALLNEGHNIRVLDNFSSGRQENIQKIAKDIELIRGDLRSPETVEKAVKGVEYILHLGAMPSVPISVKDPIGTNASNIDGTLNVLMAAREYSVNRLVFASTCAVYGDDPTLPKVETMAPNPQSPYALQKLAGEFYCRQFSDLFGVSAISLRYFNVFGKRQDPTSLYSAVIPKFVDAALSGQPITVFGDGEQTRDFIFIDDIVAANLAAIGADNSVNGKAINIASGSRMSINALIEHLSTVLGKKLSPEYKPTLKGDIRHSVADVESAGKNLAFTSKIRFEEGLAKYVAWYQSKT